ncbi:MAG: hypothetical protein JF614_31900 [Acidobacteria bacterium]|nr:hypothetical protein [Acidobacteriota bacterium]
MLSLNGREPETALLTGGQCHPEENQLERFMRGELPRTEAAPIVRHLLTGCTECRKVTGRLWRRR